jgi:hypothetical protein
MNAQDNSKFSIQKTPRTAENKRTREFSILHSKFSIQKTPGGKPKMNKQNNSQFKKTEDSRK